MTEFFRTRDAGEGITIVTLSRAPVNALTPAYLFELADSFNRLGADENVRAVVITSDLKVFSAGMDLKEAQAFGIEEQTAIVDGLSICYAALYGLPKPTITAANGAAIAGGLFFLLAADYSIAVERGKFGLTEVRVGIDFPVGPLEIARAELTPQVFRQMLLSGRNYDAHAAMAMGVVDEVIAAEDLMTRALSIARDYAAIPPLAFSKVKAQMRAGTLKRVNDTVSAKTDPTRTGWFSDETDGAMKALLAAATAKR